MTHQLFYVGVKALIKNEKNLFLILQKDVQRFGHAISGPAWDLPGGRIEVGKDPIETLTRELTEELGLAHTDFHIGKCISAAISHIIIPEPETQRGLVFFVYECSLTNPTSSITLSAEHLTYKWVTLDELKKLLQLDAYKTLLINYP